MAGREAARLGADNYQHLYSWWLILALKLPDEKVQKVIVEDDGAGFVNDIIVYHEPSTTLLDRFYQIKYHVDLHAMYSSTSLIIQNGQRSSLLEKFWITWKMLHSKTRARASELYLISNRAWDNKDALDQWISGGAGCIKIDEFMAAEQNSAVGKIRHSWQRMLEATDKDFKAFISCLRFQVGRNASVLWNDLIMDRMKRLRLRTNEEALAIIVSIVRNWIITGQREIDLDTLNRTLKYYDLYLPEVQNPLMIFDNPLVSITESDIQALIDARIAEQKNLEYKQTLPGGKDSDKKEFLADVSSFANTDGGHILYGIEEQAGLPVKIAGIKLDDDIDACKLRLEDMLRNGIDPRLPHVEIHPVALTSASGHYVLILRIQKSNWHSPHRVVFQQHGHFYARNSAGKFQLDTTQLRTAFQLSGITAKRIRDFRVERLNRISAGEETPILLEEQAPKLVLHMIPSTAFDTSISADIKILNDSSQWDLIRPLVVWDIQPPTSLRFNLDGITCSAQWIKSAEHVIPAGYVQVFRNGIVEVVDVTILGINGNKKAFLGEILEVRLLQAMKKHLELQRSLGIKPPIFIMVSLLGVKGYKINRGAFPPDYTEEIDRLDLIIPEVMIDTFDGGNDHIASILKPIFDITWNAANYPCSPNYNDDGKYVRWWS